MPKQTLTTSREWLQEQLRDPEFRELREKTAVARAVALALVKYRAGHGLTQKQLADQLGMPQPQIGRLEMGEHNPSIEMLQRLARGLGQWFIVAVGPAGPRAGQDVPLPNGAEVLEDVTTADGSRVVTAAG